MEKRVYILSDFKIDLSEGLPAEMFVDDVVDSLLEEPTFVTMDKGQAQSKKEKGLGRFIYSLTLTNE
jgi:hypothetical protein